MINFMKKWHGKIGVLDIEQVTSPFGDGDKLHVTTLIRTGGCKIQAASTLIDFADVEKLGDNAFRLGLARAAAAERLTELRADVAEIETALEGSKSAEQVAQERAS